jgi:hypothetical protein
MSECAEVAASMLSGYLRYVASTTGNNDWYSARDYVRMQMPDETVTIRDNVAQSLIEQGQS